MVRNLLKQRNYATDTTTNNNNNDNNNNDKNTDTAPNMLKQRISIVFTNLVIYQYSNIY